MNTRIFIKSLIIAALSTGAILFSQTIFAASHNIEMSVETLPNGQIAYKMISHTSSAPTPTYPTEAVIPGPTLFFTTGDNVRIKVTNNTGKVVRFGEGDIVSGRTKIKPGQTRGYSVYTGADAVGSHVYGDKKQALLGLFGAIVIDKKNGAVQSYVDEDGTIVPVTRSELQKEFVMFMVGSTFWGTEIKNNTQTPIWTNPTLGAVENDLVRFHVMGVGMFFDNHHTFHLHAHRWIANQKTLDKGKKPSIIDTRLLDEKSDNHAFTIKAGTGVGQGHWQYHCHLLSHMESGMAGKFHVMAAGGDTIAGASPYGRFFLSALLGGGHDVPGLVTFEISDEPGSWFRSTRGDAIVGLGANINTKSLEIIEPGSSVHFIMSDTNAVHTMTSLIWPSEADDPTMGGDQHMIPFDQTKAYTGGGIVKLDVPGLYVFTCKVHPYMFAAVLVTNGDGSAGNPLDLGGNVDLAMGIPIPTTSDLAARLLRTFFVATGQPNWQDFTSGSWTPEYPNVFVNANGAIVNLNDYLGGSIPVALDPLTNPLTPGVGEVWIDTQFEQTAGKTKPGTVTVLDTSDWTIKRKIALPGINMNHPHNIWSNKDQSVIFQTQWFDNKLTFIKQSDGSLIKNVKVGNSPSHVVTIPGSDEITVAINGENGVVRIPAGSTKPSHMMPTQLPGQPPANPHGHWVTSDGSKIVTPNINTSDAGIYNAADGSIVARTPTFGNFPAGPHPIAIGMAKNKFYAANLLDSSLSVIGTDGTPIKTINLIANYDPISGAVGGNGFVGVLPIQTPVDPTGRVVVTANTGGQITIVDTATDELVGTLPCDPGCHGVNFGAKLGGGYYAYVTSKFSNRLIVVDPDPNNDGDFSDATIAGTISMVDNAAPRDDTVTGLAGMGGQGIYAIPNVYDGWVQNLPATWQTDLTPEQLTAMPVAP